MATERPLKVLYVSYDGALDPLGVSQIIPYLERLATCGVVITLLSYEKPGRWRHSGSRLALQRRLDRHEIRWRPSIYHKRPRLTATVWDLLAGVVRIRQEVGRSGADLVHCRGDLPMLMARLACQGSRAKLLYDVRGFWSDERVETGSWVRGGAVDRIVRRAEAGNLARADALVVLTKAALGPLADRRSPLPPHRVIPTCVDLEVFRRPGGAHRASHGPVYCGSFGSRYMPSEIVAFAKALSDDLGQRALFLTPQVEAARRAGVTPDWADLLSVRPQDVAASLCRGVLSVFFYRPGRHTMATCPTRLAEALALGIPVACNTGIGDLDDFIEKEGVGVTVRELTDEGYRQAAVKARGLLADSATPGRCRQLAEARFGVVRGSTLYRQLYSILRRPDPGP